MTAMEHAAAAPPAGQKTGETSLDAARPQTGDAFFSCKDIHAYYGESYIVQGVSFDIQEGEILALLGRNGAGKTSTLRALARTESPALRHGEIWLGKLPIHPMRVLRNCSTS